MGQDDMVLTIKTKSFFKWNPDLAKTEIRIAFRAMISNVIVKQVAGVLGEVEDLNSEPKQFVSEDDAIAHFGALHGQELLDTANSFWPEPFFDSYEIGIEK